MALNSFASAHCCGESDESKHAACTPPTGQRWVNTGRSKGRNRESLNALSYVPRYDDDDDGGNKKKVGSVKQRDIDSKTIFFYKKQ